MANRVNLSGDESALLLWLGRKFRDRRAAGIPDGCFDPRDYRHGWPLPEGRFWAGAESLEARGLLRITLQTFFWDTFDGGGGSSRWYELGLTGAGEAEARRRGRWWRGSLVGLLGRASPPDGRQGSGGGCGEGMMPTLGEHSDVCHTGLVVLRQKGFQVWCERANHTHCAERDGRDFVADTPTGLLGLVAIYEHKRPQELRENWWKEPEPLVPRSVPTAPRPYQSVRRRKPT